MQSEGAKTHEFGRSAPCKNVQRPGYRCAGEAATVGAEPIPMPRARP